jgi:hypothetical protein
MDLSSKAKASLVGAAEIETSRQRKGRIIIFFIIKFVIYSTGYETTNPLV